MTISASSERALITASAAVTMLGGGAYVFTCWALRGQAIDGILRCATLVCAMIAVHAWGWKLYRLQGKSKLTTSLHQFIRHADLNWQVFKKVTPFSVICLQAVTWLLSGTILDGGDICRLVTATLIAYWITVLLCCFVRTDPLSRVDLVGIRYGFWILLIPTGFALNAVWHLKGLGHY